MDRFDGILGLPVGWGVARFRHIDGLDRLHVADDLVAASISFTLGILLLGERPKLLAAVGPPVIVLGLLRVLELGNCLSMGRAVLMVLRAVN